MEKTRIILKILEVKILPQDLILIDYIILIIIIRIYNGDYICNSVYL